MPKYMWSWRTFLLFACVIVSSATQAKQLAVIVDSANAISNLAAADLVNIFNGHTRTWRDGKPITIVLCDPSSSDMQLVLRKVFNMMPKEANAFVRAHPGMIVVAGSDEAVLHFVSSTQGAIGVIDLYSLSTGVNVVKIDGKLPVEQGYLLRGN